MEKLPEAEIQRSHQEEVIGDRCCGIMWYQQQGGPLNHWSAADVDFVGADDHRKLVLRNLHDGTMAAEAMKHLLEISENKKSEIK